MQEQQPETAQIPVKTPQPLFVKLIIALLVIIAVMLIVVATLIWQRFSVQQHKQQQQQQMTTMQQSQMTQRLAALEQGLQQQQQSSVDLSQQLDRLNAPLAAQRAWQNLNQIDFQVHLAQRYLMAGVFNLPLALQFIESAQQQLQLIQAPGIASVQQSLSDLHQQLQQLQSLNIASISQRLALLMQLATQLTMESTVAPTSSSNVDNHNGSAPAKTAPSVSEDHWYERSWTSLRRYLAKFVVIRHQSELIAPLSLQQQQIMSSELKLSLLQAQWALLQQDQVLYLSSLMNCTTLLQKQVPVQPLRDRLLADLGQLVKIDLNPEQPSFTEVFSTLTQTLQGLEQQKNPVAPTAVVPSNTITDKPNPTSSEKDKAKSNTITPPAKSLDQLKKSKQPTNPAVEI